MVQIQIFQIKETDCTPKLAHVYIYICLWRGRHGAPASTPSPSRGACASSAVERHIVGGERDMTTARNWRRILDTTPLAYASWKMRSMLLVVCFLFSQCKIYFALTLLIWVLQIFLSFPSKGNFLIFQPYRKFREETEITLFCRWIIIPASYVSSSYSL